MPARPPHRLLAAVAGMAALSGLVLAPPAVAGVVVPAGPRQRAALLAEPVCTDAGATLRITVPGHPEVASYGTDSGLTFTVPTEQWQLPARFRWNGDVDFAVPGGPVTVTAFAADSSIVASRTVTATVCDGFTGRADYLASGANEIGRPLAVGTLSEVGEQWPGGVVSYPGTTGELWVLPSGTAYPLPDDVARVYRSAGGPTGALGVPRTSPRLDVPRRRTTTLFTGGTVRSAPAAGTHAVTAPFNDINCTQWDMGREDPDRVPESLDYPTSEVIGPLRGGWHAQQYEGGSLYERPGLGCTPVWNGPVRDYWAATGWENGPLGYPTELTMSRTTVAFEGGTVYATATSPAAPRGVVVLDRVMDATYRDALRRPWGVIGSPVSFSTPTPDGIGRFVRLSQPGAIYSSPVAGTHVVSDEGTGLWSCWAARGWEQGPLGYPSGDAFLTPAPNAFGSSGWGQSFEGGMLYGFAATTNVHAVRGALLDRWAATGFEQSPLGFPVADEVVVPGGVAQQFQGGWLTWSSDTGRVS